MIIRIIKISILLLILGDWGSLQAQEFRSIDGRGNNPNQSEWGSSGALLRSIVSNGFADSIGTPATIKVNPRRISNELFAQNASIESEMGLSDYIWVFGQFLDHDITLVNNANEYLPIVVPGDDPIFRPWSDIPMFRSKYAPGTGTDKNNPRRYQNEITAFVDGSNIYGSTNERSFWLRSFRNGKLKMSKGNRLPWNTIDGEFNSFIDIDAPDMADDVGRYPKHFVAGDVRANENLLLTSFHTLFVREHNRLCNELVTQNPDWNDDELFEHARRIVIAILQRIAFEEWLPAMGIILEPYTGYSPDINPGISNVFSASAFRMGHTLLNNNVLRIDKDGNVIKKGNLRLRDAFFNPTELLRTDIDVYFKGMGVQMQQRLDCKMVDEVRNFLFENPKSPFSGLDLAAINIQRGRERGMPDYNTMRRDIGMQPIANFSEITEDAIVVEKFESLYTSVDEIDSWVAMLSEKHLPNSMVGEMLYILLKEQFTALRDGDRFYYKNDPSFTDETLALINASNLKSVILRNTQIECLQEEMFTMTLHPDIPCWPVVVNRNLDFSISPNPVDEIALLNIFALDDSEAHARLISIDGREVWNLDYKLNRGENHFVINLDPNLPRGLYIFILEKGDEYTAKKIFKN